MSAPSAAVLLLLRHQRQCCNGSSSSTMARLLATAAWAGSSPLQATHNNSQYWPPMPPCAAAQQQRYLATSTTLWRHSPWPAAPAAWHARRGLHTCPGQQQQDEEQGLKQQEHYQQQHEQQQQQQQQPRPPGASLTSVPNLLSLSRIAAAPAVSALMVADAWGPAAALLAAAALTDWADGAAARSLGHTSKLGSYLDPLADKVLVSAAFGTLGALGHIPAWLAAAVVGRDVAQVAVAAAHRRAQFGGKWPGFWAFIDVDGAPAGGGGGGGMPRVKPLFVSKLNTAMAFALAGGAVARQWAGWPPVEALQALEAGVAAATAASGAAYLWLWRRGELLRR